MATILDKAGTSVGNAYKLISESPLDVRFVVADTTERDSIATAKGCYPGLEVWVESEKKKYRAIPEYNEQDELTGYGWKEVGIVDDIPVYENATGSAPGLMTGTDKQRLDGLWAAWADGDDDELVNKISEVLAVFADYEEGKKIVDILASKAPKNHASEGTTYGVAASGVYGHAKPSATTPKANGSAAVGTETDTFARGDHIHPLQTSVSGNAGSADKLNSNAGSATQPIYFVDGKPAATTYALNKTVPADAKFTDTDEKVKTTARTGTTNYYLAGTVGAITGALSYDTGIKMGNAAGELIMSMCNVNTSAEPAGMKYDAKQKVLRFIVN